jgi:hypothetical protein
MVYADDPVIITKSEDELQMAVNKLNKTINKYDLKISSSNTKTVGFCGKNVQRVETEVQGKIIENFF